MFPYWCRLFGDRLKAVLKRPPEPSTSLPGETLTQVEEYSVRGGICPDCKTPTSLRMGPEGGLCINIACEVCGSEFNHNPVLTQRLSVKGKPDKERLKNIYGIEL